MAGRILRRVECPDCGEWHYDDDQCEEREPLPAKIEGQISIDDLLGEGS